MRVMIISIWRTLGAYILYDTDYNDKYINEKISSASLCSEQNVIRNSHGSNNMSQLNHFAHKKHAKIY